MVKGIHRNHGLEDPGVVNPGTGHRPLGGHFRGGLLEQQFDAIELRRGPLPLARHLCGLLRYFLCSRTMHLALFIF